MSDFQDVMTSDLSVFFDTDTFAENVEYDAGSGAVTVEAVMDSGADRGSVKADHNTILVKKSQVPAPDYRHTFTTAAGDVWYVFSDPDKGQQITGDDHIWMIPVSKEERFTQWRT